MDDLISRHALCEYAQNQKDKSVTPNDIMRFPSAQPDSKETSFTHKALDTISRKAAIEIASGFCHPANIAKELAKLPSAQPETPMQIGWICPICGRGLSPLTSVCPCNNGKGWEITC